MTTRSPEALVGNLGTTGVKIGYFMRFILLNHIFLFRGTHFFRLLLIPPMLFCQIPVMAENKLSTDEVLYALVQVEKGMAYSGLGQNKAAIKCFETALAVIPHHAEAWLGKGLNLLAKNRTEDSLRCAEKALNSNPNYPEALMMQSLAYMKLGRHAEALVSAEMAKTAESNRHKNDSQRANIFQKLHDSETSLLVKAGVGYLSERNLPQAMRAFDEALEENSRDVFALNGKALVFNLTGNHQNALEYSNKAEVLLSEKLDQQGIIPPTVDRATQNEQVTSLTELALSHARNGNHQEALSIYNKAISIDSTSIEALSGKAAVLRRLERHSEAIDCLDRVLSIDPNNIKAWNGKGISLVSLAQYDDSIQCFKNALKIDESSSESWYNKAVVLSRLNRIHEAIQCNNQALKHRPDYENALANRRFLEGRKREMEQVLGLSPEEAYNFGPELVEEWYRVHRIFEKAVELGRRDY